MPDADSSDRPEARAIEGETRNLPVPVPQPDTAPDDGERWMQRAIRVLFRWKPGTIRADLKSLLERGPPGETGFSPEESVMLKNILALRERRIEDVMLPRADIVAVQQDISLGELVRIFERAGHSRLVAYNDTLDDPVGMVHIRDLIAFMTARAAITPEDNVKRKRPLPAGLDLKAIDLAMPLSATRIVRTILFVPPSMPAMDLLAKMQATRIHLALVIDEYGGTDGLVSMEDIVEQIVGDIADEHDVDEPLGVAWQADGNFVADGRAGLEDVAAAIGIEFDVREHLSEVDTLGGYLVTKAGHVPVRGELVPGPPGFEIEVLDADPRRVKRAKIYRSKDRRATRIRDGRQREDEPDSAEPQPADDASSGPTLQQSSPES
ncbi:MAG: CBS domain-containing protein [Rhizobiales bacterium]|nr:CBS domain-containing protein [Hyphomicrobiales bacterium]